MSRKRTLIIGGLAALGTLALIEKVTNRAQLAPANIVAVRPMVPDAGPDKWRIMFELSDRNEYSTNPVTVRPLLELGDPVCVRMLKRSWAPTKYQITSDTSCWSGAVTPLRAPD